MQDRIDLGQPAGFQVGDILTYIIQFTPVSNGNGPDGPTTVGVAGYVTDYLPPGVEVVGADIVNVDASGNYYPVAPQLPGGIDIGYGGSADGAFSAPFDATATYDITGRCSAANRVDNCYGRLTEVHADTGIFYSTDPRTAAFPALPQRIQQGTNGYNINPTVGNNLNDLLGQARATTHNLWDANQTNAFGTGAGNLPTTAPFSAATVIASNGRGAIPFNAGSAVAGPQTGYTQDNTAGIGPWKRIAYPGSRIGDPTTGPVAIVSDTRDTVGGMPTGLGVVLSESNPLPAGTNAVRWAVGKLVVGQISYVRIKLRITQPVPTEGIVNSSEVWGGDAGDGDDGKDNPWRYHVPSVADNNSNLFVRKIACTYDAEADACSPLPSPYHPPNTTITYQITYLNTGNLAQTNVVLRDIVPCQTGANTVVTVGTVTGPLASLITVPYTSATANINGDCNSTPQTRATITFPAITTLAPAAGGRLIINVRNTATALNQTVINTARLSSNQVSGGITSNAITFVGNDKTPALNIVKTTPVSTSTAGGTVLYVVSVHNAGTGSTVAPLFIRDLLPSNGGSTTNTAARFNFNNLVSIASTGLSPTTALVISTSTVAAGGLAPYNAAPGAINTVQVNFNFGANSELAAGGRITISFVASIGSAMNASTTPYYNTAVVLDSDGATPNRSDTGPTAPVTLLSELSVRKKLECFYLSGVCTPVNSAGDIPPNAKVRYRIDYANAGGGSLSNVVLSDTLPCQMTTTIPAVTVVAVISGPIAPTGTLPSSVTGSFAGVCPNTRASFAFTPTTLIAGQTGALVIEAQLSTPATTSNVVINEVRLSALGASTVTAQVQNVVATRAELLITKTAFPSIAPPGTTVNYAITVQNVGTTAAQTVTVYDILPTGITTTVDVTRRFSYVNGSSVVAGSLSTVVPSTRTGPTLAPYNLAPNASNQEQISWTFAGQTLPVGASATIQFTALVGSNLPALAPPNYYNNYAVVTYHNAQQATSNAASANVSLAANLSISKSNGTTTLAAGETTAYTVTVANGGPSAANGAVIRDVASAGLLCTSVTCAQTTGSATCPVALPLNSIVLTGATAFFSSGEALPAFPANSSVTFVVRCNVTATGQ